MLFKIELNLSAPVVRPTCRAVTMWPKTRQVVLGWLNPYIIGHYQLEVVNDVFNGMRYDMSYRPGRTRSAAAWCHAVRLPGTVAVHLEWSTGPTLHCSRTVAACPHVLHALNVQPTHMYCRPMMTLTLDTLKIWVRALQTREFSFMLEVCDLQETAGRVTALEPSRQGGRIQSRRACDGTGALHDTEEGSGAMIYVAAPESKTRFGVTRHVSASELTFT
jgi:hypothetical protein